MGQTYFETLTSDIPVSRDLLAESFDYCRTILSLRISCDCIRAQSGEQHIRTILT